MLSFISHVTAYDPNIQTHSPWPCVYRSQCDLAIVHWYHPNHRIESEASKLHFWLRWITSETLFISNRHMTCREIHKFWILQITSDDDDPLSPSVMQSKHGLETLTYIYVIPENRNPNFCWSVFTVHIPNHCGCECLPMLSSSHWWRVHQGICYAWLG